MISFRDLFYCEKIHLFNLYCFEELLRKNYEISKRIIKLKAYSKIFE